MSVTTPRRSSPRRPAGPARAATVEAPAPAELRGVVVKVIARKPSFWTAMRIRPTSTIPDEEKAAGAIATDGTVSVAGIIPVVEPNAEMQFSGRWDSSKFGRQFVPQDSEILHSSDERGIALELEGALPNVGPVRARQMIELLGRGPEGLPGVWTALDRTDLADVLTAGRVCSPDHAAAIAAACQDTKHQREMRAWMRARGCGPAQSAQIIAEYGNEAQHLVEQDPYRLMELDRWGFLSADAIAQNLRIPKEHPGRVRAAIVHCLQEAADRNGHIFLPLNSPPELVRSSNRHRKLHEQPRCGLLDHLAPWDVDPERALLALREMDGRSREELARKEEGLLAADDPHALRRRKIHVIVEGGGEEARAYLLPYWEAEREAARRVRSMIGGARPAAPKARAVQVELPALRTTQAASPVLDLLEEGSRPAATPAASSDDDWASMLDEADRRAC